MKANLHSLSTNRPRRGRAFTLVDLLVVIAVIALLLTLRLSAQVDTRDQTLRAQCAGNIHHLALASAIIANDNSDKLPINTSGNWAWDMSWNVGNTLTNYFSLQTMYCPASGFNYDDNNNLWVYNLGSIHVIGYAQALPGTADVIASNLNTTLTPQRIQVGSTLLPAPLASQRVLFADAVVSAPGQVNPASISQYQWVNIQGVYPKQHRTSHMDGALPAGGNVAMLDGHVEWRNFSQMSLRSPSIGNPEFWW